jgi:AraC-like DNA-binding protein
LDALIRQADCTLTEFAQEASLSERHLHNIFNGTTKLARFKTKKKIQEALQRLKISRPRSDAAFRQTR